MAFETYLQDQINYSDRTKTKTLRHCIYNIYTTTSMIEFNSFDLHIIMHFAIKIYNYAKKSFSSS